MSFRSILPWLQLVRLPNHFTAWADVLAGFLFVKGAYQPPALLMALVGSSWALYAGGMVFNDLFDLEQDARQRPDRPLPSGKISPRAAMIFGSFLLGGGVGLAGMATFQSGDPRSVILAVALVGCILAYDGGLKRSALGPLIMGSCRTLNLLLGMTAGKSLSGWWGFEPAGWVAAVALGVYVCGITWFAREEAGPTGRRPLLVGLRWMFGGLAMFACIDLAPPFSNGLRAMRFEHRWVWPLLIALIGFNILRRAVMVVASEPPVRVGPAVKMMIFSIVVLDAALALAVAPVTAALGILALLIPAFLFGKLIYST
ncbi:MAG: UbiA family prenyltransferase [Planctomycetota bacterium]